MSVRKRRHFTPEQKVVIVRRHLLEQVPVSDLSDEYEISPAVFWRGGQGAAGRIIRAIRHPQRLPARCRVLTSTENSTATGAAYAQLPLYRKWLPGPSWPLIPSYAILYSQEWKSSHSR